MGKIIGRAQKSKYGCHNHCPSIISIAILITTNAHPNAEDLTVFCLFEYHSIGAVLTKKITPVCDLLVT